MKRTISLLLVLVMLLSLSGGLAAFADELDVAGELNVEELTETVADPAAEAEIVPDAAAEPEDTDEADTGDTDEADAGDTDEADAGDTDAADAGDTDEADAGDTDAADAEDTDEAETEDTDEADAEELALDGADEVYTEISGFGADGMKTYVAIVNVDQKKALTIDKMAGGKDVTTISGEAPNRICSIESGIGALVMKHSTGEGYSLQLNDPPETRNFIYLDATGSLARTESKAGVSSDTYANWYYEDGKLYYLDGTTKYYLKSDLKTGTTDAAEAGTIVLFTGDTAKNGGGGGGGGKTETVDAEAPTITTQPSGKIVTSNASERVTFTVEAENSESVSGDALISYQWTQNGVEIEGATEASLTVNSSTTCGIEVYRCRVTTTVTAAAEDNNAGEGNTGDTGDNGNTGDTGDAGKSTTTTHITESAPAALIVYSGVQNTGDILMFSDVHQEPENIADVLGVYMEHNSGALPAFVVASGDYHNSGTETDADVIKATLAAIEAMLGSDKLMKIFWLAGNHESDNVIVDKNGGETGLIYSDDMYIYTINYDEIKDSSSYEGMLDKIKEDLEGMTEEQPVIFLAHAGVHTLDGSAGKASYNINASDRLVDLLNEYAKTKKIFFFFGHNHSKGETPFFKTAGDGSYIISTKEWDDTLALAYNRQIALNFSYGHMGYLNTKIGGGETASVMHIEENKITLQRIALDKETGKVIYSGDEVKAVAPDGKTVPVVKALDKRYDLGVELEAKVEGARKGDATFKYQWYKAAGIDLTTALSEAAAIDGATGSRYEPAEDGYYFCRVTRTDNVNSFATTTVTRIGVEEEPEEEAFPAGKYVIVLKEGDKSYALLCDEGNNLSVKEIELRSDGTVADPKSDFYLWNFASPSKGGARNEGSGYYLGRTGGGGRSSLTMLQDGTSKYANAWVYDDAKHILYIESTGGSKTYYYPAVENGALTLASMSTLGEANVYLVKADGAENGPVIKEGASITVKKGESLTITSTAEITDFLRVELDGKELVKGEDYDVKAGSTIVTLKAECLAKIGPGKHTLAIVSTTGTAKTELVIKASESTDDAETDETTKPADKTDSAEKPPLTGDESNLTLWLAVALLASCAAVATVVVSRKKTEA